MAPTAAVPTAVAHTFAALWERAVAQRPEAPFLLFHDDGGTTTWTYAEFDDRVARVAGTLAARGVRRGDSVHVALRNSPAFVAVWLAAARLGACLVPVDPASPAREIGVQLRRVGARAGVHALARAEAYLRGTGTRGPDAPAVLGLTETAADLDDGAPLVAGPPVAGGDPEPGDRLGVMFTSGTTSAPKGVVLTQAAYVSAATGMAAADALTADDRYLVTLPLFHANAQYYCFGPAIATGASVALTRTFSASRWLDQAAQLRATHASLFAAPIRMILARTPHEAPPAGLVLRHVWFAQSLGPGHFARFAELAACAPRQLYGMTETLAAVTVVAADRPRHDLIGAPLPGRRIRIVDAETGEVTPTGPGVLEVRGTRGRDLLLEYLDDPAVTARSFTDLPDGTSWFRTGDVVAADPGTGLLRFVGRADDVIKVAGENVSLTEVEAVLAQAPGVLETAVLGRPDPVRDTVPVAFVVPRDPAAPPTEAQLRAFAEENLAPAARPVRWELIDELPRTSVGKVRRFALGPGADPAPAPPG